MISVIIPFRNEANHLADLLADLSAQEGLDQELEILCVDDHSTDGGREIVKRIQAKHPDVSILLLGPSSHIFSKKSALKAGVAAASGEILLFTDADSRIPAYWAQGMASLLGPNSPFRMVCGPVGLIVQLHFVEMLQLLESAALLMAAHLSSAAGYPLLSSGASLGIRKDTLLALGEDPWQMAYPSGDDVFLMKRVQEVFGKKSVKFLLEKSIVVQTPAKKDWSGLFHQRARWISKNLAVPGWGYIASFSLVALSNLIPVGLILMALLYPKVMIVPLLLAWGVKMFTDALLIYPGLSFLSQERHFCKYFFQASLLYPFLAVYIALLSLRGGYQWKGR